MSAARKITEKAQFPKERHYAALTFENNATQHDGGLGCGVLPWRGYPAYTETVKTVHYYAFKDKADMESWVLEQEARHNKTPYQLIESGALTAQLHTHTRYNMLKNLTAEVEIADPIAEWR